MEITTAGWVQRQQSDTEQWDWMVPEDSKSRGWISNYADTNRYFWEASRHAGY